MITGCKFSLKSMYKMVLQLEIIQIIMPINLV